jgi:hypothetical protein
VKTSTVKTSTAKVAAAKVTAVVPPPGSDAGPEALIREARRRHRRRQLITGLAAVAVLASGLGAFAGLRGSGQPPAARPPAGRPRPAPAASHPAAPQAAGLIPRSTDSTVLMWPVGPGQAPGIYLDNLRTRRLRQAFTPSVDPGEFQPLMPTGRWLVYVQQGKVLAVPVDGPGRPRVLGTTLPFAPSATPGHVWLQYGIFPARRGPVRVRSVSIASGRAGPPVTLPAGTQLIAGTDAGLLLSARYGSPLLLWTPGAMPVSLPYSARAQALAVSARLVAYETGCRNEGTAQNLSYGGNYGYSACRMLRVYDVVTGRLRSFAAPPGTSGWVPVHGGYWSVSAIARSGAVLAAEAVVPPDSRGVARVFVLHLTGRHRRATAVPSSAAFLLSVTAWSPDGSWLFYQGPGQRLAAYQVATGRVRSSSTPCCQYAVMAAIRSLPG